MDAMLLGLKEGSTKRAIDKIVGKISDPVATFLLEKIKEQVPTSEYSDSTIRVLTHATVLLAISEILGFALYTLPAVNELSKDSAYREKAVYLERYLRFYASEKAGQEFIGLLWNFLPLLISQVSELSTDDLKNLSPVENGVEVKLIAEQLDKWIPPTL